MAGSTVLLEGVPSGRISAVGLRYVTGMTYVFGVPEGTGARVLPDTGSTEVRSGATVSVAGSTATMVLPGRVPEGSAYTPPTLELRLPGPGPVELRGFRVTARAFLVGDVTSTCEPTSGQRVVARVP